MTWLQPVLSLCEAVGHPIELLFGKILKLPTALVDITTYSETGYVGQDPSTILTRLLHTADENPMLASIGVVAAEAGSSCGNRPLAR